MIHPFNYLSKEQQTEALLSSQTLMRQVGDEIHENEVDYMYEMLEPFKNQVSYEFGYGSYNYIRFNGESERQMIDFLDGVLKSTENYGLMKDSVVPFVKKLLEKSYVLWNMSLDNKQYDNLYTYIDKGIEFVCAEISNMMESMFDYCYDEKHIIEYFHEFYMENRMEVSEYSYDEDSKKLYRTSTKLVG